MNPDRSTCTEAERTILHLAGELSLDQAGPASMHLAECPYCTLLAADLSRVENAYRLMERPILGDRGELPAGLVRTDAGSARAPVDPPWRRSGPRRMAAAAAMVALFAAGVVTGILVSRDVVDGIAGGGDEEARLASTGLRAASPIVRVRATAQLASSEITPTVAAELLRLLQTEPNPNVRLGILDALGTAGPMTQAHRQGLLDLLATEPVPALRIEILELVSGGMIRASPPRSSGSPASTRQRPCDSSPRPRSPGTGGSNENGAAAQDSGF